MSAEEWPTNEPIVEVVDTVEVTPEPTIYDQAYWGADNATLNQDFERFRGVSIHEMPEVELRRFVAFLWRRSLVHDKELQTLAMEPRPVEAAPEPSKPVRKQRAKARVEATDVA